jgi:PAS domain S-box-containing protein
MTRKPAYEELEQRTKELERELLKAKSINEEFRNSGGIRQLLNFAPYAIFLIDLSGKVVAANKRGAEHLGKEVEEILSTALRDYFPQNVAENRKVKGIEVLKSLKPANFEDRVGNRWYSNSIFPVLDDRGKVTHLAIYGADITDFRMKEEALRASEGKYRALFETMTEGAFRQRADGALVDVNAAALKMLGLARDEFLSRTSESPAWEVVHEDGSRLPGVEHPSMVALRTGNPVFGVVLGARNEQTQERVWMEINAIPEFHSGERKPYQVMVTIHDITERKRAEEALLFKENIIQYSSSVIATCDLEGKMTYGNPTFLKTWGFDDPKEFLGRPFGEFWLVEDRLDEIMKVLRGVGTWFGEIKARRKDGSIFDVQVSAAMVFDRWGNPFALTSTSIDVTERKLADEALRESEQRLRLAVKTAGLAIWDWDIGSNTVRWDNPREILFDGTPEKEGGYKWWAERIHPEDRDAVLSAFDDALTDTDESLVLEYRFRLTEGTWANLYDRSHIMRDKSGRAYRVIGAVMDVTALRRAEEELRRSRDEMEGKVRERTRELARANEELCQEMTRREEAEQQLRQSQKLEAIGTLTGGIAHDFNNILTAIVINCEMALWDLPQASRARNNLDLILKSGLRGQELVRQMLLFSRKSPGKQGVIPMVPLIKETFKLLRSAIPATIQMNLELATESDSVMADPSQMQQVIMNLCTNAAYAMRGTTGCIDISLQAVTFGLTDLPEPDMQPGDYLVLSVKDTGCGMDEEVRKRIFEPFFTTKPAGEGTGLGLSVAYGIVKSHRGRITVYSEPGRGSIFRVYIPRADTGTPRRVETLGPIPGGKERILLVDDEEMIVNSVRNMLQHLGYQVTALMDSQRALKLFSENPSQFDLVVTDQTMPLMTGEDLGKVLMNMRPDIPVILCTGYSDLISCEQAMAMGFQGFIMKPFTIREGAELVRRVLDRKRSNEASPN